MFAIINELKPSDKDGSQTRQSNLIIRNSITTACLSYLVVGIFGYLTFGNSVNANIITMYPRNSISSLIGRLCIVLMVSLSFPLQCHPCRGSINHVMHFLTHGVQSSKMRAVESTSNQGYTSLNSDIQSLQSIGESSTVQDESFISTTPMEGAQDTDGHDPIIVPLTSKKFYIITTVIVVASYLVAISVKSLAHVLAFVGSTGSTSISFILPGLFGYLLIKPLNGASELDTLEKFCKYGGLALSIWGVLVMIVCLSATIFLGATH
jgi:amino acid permease